MIQKTIKYSLCLAVALFAVSCKNGEDKLLQPKVYFEKSELIYEIPDGQKECEFDILARVSNTFGSDVEVCYEAGNAQSVDLFNQKSGTEYEAFNAADVNFSSNKATIAVNSIFASPTKLKLTNLDKIKEGKSAVLPIRIKSASLPVINGNDIYNIVLTSPVRIKKAGKFNNSYIKVPFDKGSKLQSLTYEALIKFDWFGENNTVMGTEGILILRVGDSSIPDGHNDWIQIAGQKKFHAEKTFVENKWYHVAFTYDQPSGKASIYINGEVAAEATWDTPSFDVTADGGGFHIGKVAGFKWGERPFFGNMAEVRIWNIARNANQIKQNMLNVDPKSDGLVAYYKLNGKDQETIDGLSVVKDASGHLNGLANGGKFSLEITDLKNPVEIQ